MTNEEAKDYIREWCPYDRQEEIIKALEQEPCEDAVSLDGVIDTIEWYRTNPQHFTEDNLIEDIKGLPSVTPKQRTGKWMPVENDNMEVVGHYCSICDLPMETEEKSNFCPNCGAKMEEGGRG